MRERELRLDELVERVADLEPIDAEPVHLSDVEPEREGWLTANLRLLAAIGSLGPGELGGGSEGPGVHWGPLQVVGPVRPGDDEIFVARSEDGSEHWLRLLPPARRHPRRGLRDLEREAEVLGRIRHPALVRVGGAGSFEGRSGIWAKAVEGDWLCDASGPPSTWNEACGVVLAIAEVLGILHSHGLIHRRLAPDRIVKSPAGPVLVDLGARDPLARDADEPLAPEVSRGAAPTVRTDFHALGVLLLRIAGVSSTRVADSRLAALLHPEPEHRPAGISEVIELLNSLREREPNLRDDPSGGRGWARFFRRGGS